MSRAWIAFYMGDYQKKTNRLTTLEHGAYFLLLQECWTNGMVPPDAADRAAISKMPLKDWLKIAPKINSYFEEDGTNNRANEEIEKADVTRLKRAIAGKVGGVRSGISRAITKGRAIKNEAKLQARDNQNMKPDEATLNSKTTTSSSEAEPRAGKMDADALRAYYDTHGLGVRPKDQQVS